MSESQSVCRRVSLGKLFLIFEKLLSFYIRLEHVVDNSFGCVSDLLLDQQDLQMLWGFGELTASKGVHETSFTDTVTANQTILAAVGQLEVSTLE